MNYKTISNVLFFMTIIVFVLFNICIISYGHSLTYDVETNNCRHMSRQLEDVIESAGVPVTIKTGGREDGVRHMWIEVGWFEFDSITLFPVVGSEYNQERYEYVSFDEYEKGKEM